MDNLVLDDLSFLPDRMFDFTFRIIHKISKAVITHKKSVSLFGGSSEPMSCVESQEEVFQEEDLETDRMRPEE